VHELFDKATERTAVLLDDESRHDECPYLLEADLDEAMVRALKELSSAPVAARRQRWIPGWDPQPGQLDSSSGTLIAPPVTCDSRLKSSGAMTTRSTRGFGTRSRWCPPARSREWRPTTSCTSPHGDTSEKPVECARELFPDTTEPSRIDVPSLIEQHVAWWTRYILGDSRGRFAAAPRWTSIELVKAADLTVVGKPWQIRTVAVRAAGDELVTFKDGLPQRGFA
jgi:hypothetical protein